MGTVSAGRMTEHVESATPLEGRARVLLRPGFGWEVRAAELRHRHRFRYTGRHTTLPELLLQATKARSSRCWAAG